MKEKTEHRIKNVCAFITFCLICLFAYHCCTHDPEADAENIRIERRQAYNDSLNFRIDSIRKFRESWDTHYWLYKTIHNPSTNKTCEIALHISNTLQSLSYPYYGGSFLYIIIKTTNQKQEVLLMIDNGEFVDLDKDTLIPIKFENPYPEFKDERVFHCRPHETLSNILYIKESQELINLCLKSGQIDIKVPIIQEGWKSFNIPVFGLWYKDDN